MAVLFKSGSGARIATYLIACAVLVTCLVTIIPKSVSAEIGFVLVDGKVTDSAGRPMNGADVVVVMKNGTITVDTQTSSTDSEGFYTVNLGLDKWEVGFNVISTATYNSVEVSDNATLSDFPFITIDLQYTFEIPQFGSILGFVAAAALVGVIAVVFLARKSK
jgi:hypothetical protein